MAGNKLHADHVGSLLRPPELVTARAAFAEGAIVAARLREVEDQSVLAAIELQHSAGMEIFTDGEYRRAMTVVYRKPAINSQDSLDIDSADKPPNRENSR